MLFLLVWIGCAVGCNQIAKAKGRNATAWAIAGVLFGVFALAVVALLPKTSSAPSSQQPAGISWSPQGVSLTPPAPPSKPVGDIATQLRDLNQLLQDGLITQREFDQKRQNLINQM